jgi:hypothetical protein
MLLSKILFKRLLFLLFVDFILKDDKSFKKKDEEISLLDIKLN